MTSSKQLCVLLPILLVTVVIVNQASADELRNLIYHRFITDFRNGGLVENDQFAIVVFLPDTNWKQFNYEPSRNNDGKKPYINPRSSVSPPDGVQYGNYLAARPIFGEETVHSEVQIVNRLEHLYEQYEAKHKKPPNAMLIYSWIVPCVGVGCTDMLIDTLKKEPYSKIPNKFLRYTTKGETLNTLSTRCTCNWKETSNKFRSMGVDVEEIKDWRWIKEKGKGSHPGLRSRTREDRWWTKEKGEGSRTRLRSRNRSGSHTRPRFEDRWGGKWEEKEIRTRPRFEDRRGGKWEEKEIRTRPRFEDRWGEKWEEKERRNRPRFEDRWGGKWEKERRNRPRFEDRWGGKWEKESHTRPRFEDRRGGKWEEKESRNRPRFEDRRGEKWEKESRTRPRFVDQWGGKWEDIGRSNHSRSRKRARSRNRPRSRKRSRFEDWRGGKWEDNGRRNRSRSRNRPRFEDLIARLMLG